MLFQQLSIKNFFALIILSALHVLLDFGRNKFTAFSSNHATITFFLGELLHLLLIASTSFLISQVDIRVLGKGDRILGILITLVFAVWTAGVIIGLLLDDPRLREV